MGKLAALVLKRHAATTHLGTEESEELNRFVGRPVIRPIFDFDVGRIIVPDRHTFLGTG